MIFVSRSQDVQPTTTVGDRKSAKRIEVFEKSCLNMSTSGYIGKVMRRSLIKGINYVKRWEETSWTRHVWWQEQGGQAQNKSHSDMLNPALMLKPNIKERDFPRAPELIKAQLVKLGTGILNQCFLKSQFYSEHIFFILAFSILWSIRCYWNGVTSPVSQTQLILERLSILTRHKLPFQ